MKKILFISQTSFFGGAEIVLCDYLNSANKNMQSYLITSSKDNIKKRYESILLNTKIYSYKFLEQISIRKKPIKTLIYLFFTIYYMHKIIKKENIDIIYGNNTVDIVAVTLYKKLLNNNIIVIQHIHDILQRKIYLKYINRYDYLIDAYIVPSTAGKNSFFKYVKNQKKIFVVYNGVSTKRNLKNINNLDIYRKYKIPSNKKIIAFIGQITKRKRLDLFIDIVNGLNEKNNKYFGIIIGNSMIDKIYYEEQYNRLNGNFKYLGELPRKLLLEEIYPMIDFLMLTSDRDPLPTVILEAMNFGAIVLSRNVDGVSDIINDGIDGILWNYNDNLSMIIDKLDKYLNDEEKLICIRNNAYKKIDLKFNSNIKVELINKIINNIFK